MCSSGSKTPSVPGTPNPLGVQVGLGYIHLINGMGPHFPIWFYRTPSCPRGSGPGLLSSFDRI